MIDPRTKLIGSVLFIMTLFLLPSMAYLLGVMGVAHFLLLLSKVRGGEIKKIWKTLGPISFFILIFWLLFSPSLVNPFFEWHFIKLGWDNLHGCFLMIFRLWALVFVCYYPLLTLKQSTMIIAFVRMGMPYNWAFTIVLAMESVPDFTNRWQQVRQAQQVRGLDLSSKRISTRIGNLLPLLTAVIVSAIRDSEQLTYSLINRGMDSSRERTWLEELNFRWYDGIILILLTSFTIYLIIKV